MNENEHATFFVQVHRLKEPPCIFSLNPLNLFLPPAVVSLAWGPLYLTVLGHSLTWPSFPPGGLSRLAVHVYGKIPGSGTQGPRIRHIGGYLRDEVQHGQQRVQMCHLFV